MKRKVIRGLREVVNQIARTMPTALMTGLLSATAIMLLWVTTEWQVQDVVYMGLMITCLGLCTVQIILTIRRERMKTRIIEKRRYDQRRRACFRNINLKGEFIEVEVPGTDLVEIRHVVAKE